MMYADMYGIETSNNQMSNSFNLTESNFREVAKHIATALTMNSLFFNIQISSEGSQYDIIMSAEHFSQGLHQRGIRYNDLIIGVIGFGCYGFRCEPICITSMTYYKEKLGVCSELLMLLFNAVRMELGGVSKC